MVATVVIVSTVIKLISLAMIVYTFQSLSREENKNLSVLTKYFLLKRNYTLLRFSLIFIATLVVVELVNMFYRTINAPPLSEPQLLISDAVFIGLILLLTKIYESRHYFTQEIDKETQHLVELAKKKR